MADGLELKRIVDLVAQTDIDEGVYTIIDSVSGAVKKYPLGSFICSVAPIFDATAAYAAGAYCNYNGQLYQFDEAHAAGAWTGEDATAVTLSQILGENGEDISDLQGDVSSLQTDMAGKADANGNYPNMTVGNADQLVSSVKIEDQVPYQFRTSGGSADIGDREYDKIVGGTIAWNQLLRDSVYREPFTVQSGESAFHYFTTADTANRVPFIEGHKYLFYWTQDNTMTSNVRNAPCFNDGDNHYPSFIGENARLTKGQYCWVFSASHTTTMGDLALWCHTPDVNVTYRDFNLIDLTAMFGSGIADYIYNLDASQEGSGFAKLKSWGFFAKGTYTRNFGELMSVSGLESHDMTGFNQWDEEWELGIYDLTTGEKAANNECIRNKNLIPVLPDTRYCWNNGSSDVIRFVYYDASGNRCGSYGSTQTSPYVFVTPSDAYYFAFYFSGTTYNNDLCINLHWDGERDGEYEPYELHSYALDDSLTLRGIPKLDANNALYYDGDTYESDGTVTRKYGIVDLGTLEWTKDTSGTYARFAAEDNQLANKWKPTDTYVRANGLFCAQYVPDRLAVGGGVDKGISGYQGSTSIYISDSVYASSTADQFKTAMSGVYLVYELATPTTEEADPFQNPQIVNDWGTEEYVTESIVPVGHDTLYQPNLRAKLEMAPNSPDGDGDYIVRQTDGENFYVPLEIPTELPAAPTTDGNYKLRVSVSGGTATYSWVSDS